MKTRFRGTPGQWLIDRERFAFADDIGNIIQRSSWANSVKPGSRIDTSVLVRRGVHDDGDNHCPKCTRQLVPRSRTWYGWTVVDGRSLSLLTSVSLHQYIM